MLKYVLHICIILLAIACEKDVDQNGIPLIIDADTANEVDDLFALVRAIHAPEINLLGISSAQFHISPLATDTTVLESQEINEEIKMLLHATDLPLPVGSNTPINAQHLPAVSEASEFIIERAHEYSPENPLHIAILGSCTNVASAILQDPTIISNIKILYLGFWHDPKTNTYDKKEFNSGNDTIAVNVLLDTEDLKLEVMTATTSQHLVFKKEVVDSHLKGKGGIGDYLVNRWDRYNRWWTDEDPEKREWIMWDLALIEAIIHPELATKKAFDTPPENSNRRISIYTSINVDAMSTNFWDHIDRITHLK